MDCPRCKLVNPDTAKRCDCGYDFETKTVETPFVTVEPKGIGTTVKIVSIGILGVVAFMIAANNTVALALWLGFRFAWWPLLAPSCLYTPNGLPATPPQDYLINLAIFVPLAWLAWTSSRRKPRRDGLIDRRGIYG